VGDGGGGVPSFLLLSFLEGPGVQWGTWAQMSGLAHTVDNWRHWTGRTPAEQSRSSFHSGSILPAPCPSYAINPSGLGLLKIASSNVYQEFCPCHVL
jgi:hypothetical protein